MHFAATNKMSQQNLIIISAGKFGREVFTWAQQSVAAGTPWTIKGFLDSRQDVLDRYAYEVPILGSLDDYSQEPDDLFICGIGEPEMKLRYCSVLAERGARFATLIHPTALVGHDVYIGEGSIVGPYTQLSCDIRLGKHVAFGTHSNTAHDTRIGDYSQISGSCEINGNAEIGDMVFLGSHATILPRVHIGSGAFVGAGSVVLKNVRAGAKVFGNPAVEIGRA
jgi:sugar O-acyltransferase (sialic acid O-acetyltransferase NeuD family)